jgi:hypothetical protein
MDIMFNTKVLPTYVERLNTIYKVCVKDEPIQTIYRMTVSQREITTTNKKGLPMFAIVAAAGLAFLMLRG